MFEHSNSDRVQLRTMGDLLHPACCGICGSGTCEEGYLDLGIYYDYEGQVYLCMLCTIQVIEVIGGLSPDEVKGQQVILESTQRENAELKEKVADYELRLTPVLEFLSRNRIDLSKPEPSATVSANSSMGQQSKSDAKPTVGATTGESTPKESSQGTRPNYPQRPQRRNTGIEL